MPIDALKMLKIKIFIIVYYSLKETFERDLKIHAEGSKELKQEVEF